MRAVKLCSFILMLTPALAGCATGRINTGWPFPVEPAAAAAIQTKDGVQPLRQMQVNLTTLLATELGKAASDKPAPTAPARGAPAASEKTGKVGDRYHYDESNLDQLIALVSHAQESVTVRNNVVAAVVAASTANCSIYVQGLRSGQVNSRLMTDFFAGGFATISTIASPPAAAWFSALSAFSTAEGSSVDRNIFAQQSAELVADAILQLRSADRIAIEAKMAKPYQEWPMGLALADLFAFHGDCSMLRGFSRMRDALTAREQAVESIRSAAGAVAKAGGSPAQVIAVLSGLPSEQALAPNTPPPSSDDWGSDLNKMRDAAANCIEQFVDAVRLAPTKALADTEADFKKTTPSCNPTAAWFSGYAAIAWTLVETDTVLPTLINKNPAAVEADFTASKTRLKKAFLDTVNTKLALNINARTMAMNDLALWPTNRTVDDLVNTLKAAQGAEFASDPVFTVSIAAANNAKVVGAPDASRLSVSAASQARAAAQAYVRSASGSS